MLYVLANVWNCVKSRITKVYNEAAERTGKHGRMYGLAGDIRRKVMSILHKVFWLS